MAAISNGFLYFKESAAPSFFCSCAVTDGGLLTISRFPIVESEFHEYNTPAVLSDHLSAKGALYTKIDLSAKLLNGRKQHLHLF